MVKIDKETRQFVVAVSTPDLEDYFNTLRSLVRLISDRNRDLDPGDTVENVAMLIESMIPTVDEIKEIIKAGKA